MEEIVNHRRTVMYAMVRASAKNATAPAKFPSILLNEKFSSPAPATLCRERAVQSYF